MRSLLVLALTGVPCLSVVALCQCSSGGGASSMMIADGGLQDGTSAEAASTDASSTADVSTPEAASGDATTGPSGPPVWSKSSAPLPFAPFAVHGSRPDDIWVLGRADVSTDAGSTTQVLVARFDGTSWQSVPTPATMHDPRAIFAGGSMGTFVATAYSGTVYRWDGTSWSAVFQPSVTDVYAFGGTSASDLWLGTQWNFGDGPLYRFDGASWTQVPIQNGQDGVNALLSVGPDDVFAAFDTAIARGDSTGNFNAVVQVTGVNRLVGAAPDDIWAMGFTAGATISLFAFHSDGTTWKMAQGPGGESLTDGACVAKGDCWLIGSTSSSGTLFHTENGNLVSQAGKPGAPPGVTLVWAIGKDNLIAFNNADVYRYAPGP